MGRVIPHHDELFRILDRASGWSSTVLTTLKIALFAPMPSASASTATLVKPGFFQQHAQPVA